VELSRYLRRGHPRDDDRVYPAFPLGVWGFASSVTSVLVDSDGVWRAAAGVGVSACCVTSEVE
jgi:hypothetical protein